MKKEIYVRNVIKKINYFVKENELKVHFLDFFNLFLYYLNTLFIGITL